MHSLSFLAPANYATAQLVLSELDRCVVGEWLLAGSLSYRPWLPRRAQGGHLHDIDVVLDPFRGRVPARAMVRPNIRDHFRVTHRHAMYSGQYFGMVHRASRLWVDIYTTPHLLRSEPFALDRREVAGQVPEETFFALIREFVCRTSRHRAVRPKWIATAEMLWQHIDHDLVFELMDRHRREYRGSLPPRAASGSMGDIVEYALAVPTRELAGPRPPAPRPRRRPASGAPRA